MDAYSLGQYLREAREDHEIEIADAVDKLRIRQPILEAFEAGKFEIRGLPEIQVRGLLRIYARFLDLDEEGTLLLYDQMRVTLEKGRRTRRGRRRPEEAAAADVLGKSQPLQEIQVVERRAAGCRGALRVLVLLLFSAAAIAVIAFVTLELVELPLGGEASPSPEVIAGAVTATPGATAAPTDTFIAPTPSNRRQYNGSGILVSLLLTQRSWVGLVVDGVEQFSGIAAPDTLLEYSAADEINLAASNALALDIIWNGQQQPQIGGRGQRADIRFSAEEAVVVLGPAGAPTPLSPTAATAAAEAAEATSTPSQTPGPSATPTDTSAPSATFTPAPSDTPAPSGTPTAGQPTAILPPRVTQAGLPPTKEGA